MDDPSQLIGKSVLTSQLKAKTNAVSYFLNKHTDLASILDNLTNEEKALLASRARELADELQEEALNVITSETGWRSSTHKGLKSYKILPQSYKILQPTSPHL